jgi:hypothetical protein
MSDKPIRLPRRVGKPVPIEDHKKGATLTPFEAATLAKLDLDVEQLPQGASLETLVAAVIDEDRRQLALESPVPPDTPPIVFDEDSVVPIDRLNERQRAKLMEKIKELHLIDKEIPRQRSNIPGMEATLAAASAPTLVAPDGRTDRKPRRKKGEPQPEEPAAEAEAAAAPAAVADAGARPHPKHCPKCRHDLAVLDPLVVDRQDKLAWIASLYGSRFKKDYLLFDGQIRVVFQSLTTNETQLAYTQTQRDMRNHEFTLDDYMTRLTQYRLALMLESVTYAGGKTVVVPKDLVLRGKPVDLKHADETNLPALREYIFEHVVSNESFARIVHAKHSEFQRLLEWMEANADNPDFMKEISGRS